MLKIVLEPSLEPEPPVLVPKYIELKLNLKDKVSTSVLEPPSTILVQEPKLLI